MWFTHALENLLILRVSAPDGNVKNIVYPKTLPYTKIKTQTLSFFEWHDHHACRVHLIIYIEYELFRVRKRISYHALNLFHLNNNRFLFYVYRNFTLAFPNRTHCKHWFYTLFSFSSVVDISNRSEAFNQQFKIEMYILFRNIL